MEHIYRRMLRPWGIENILLLFCPLADSLVQSHVQLTFYIHGSETKQQPNNQQPNYYALLLIHFPSWAHPRAMARSVVSILHAGKKFVHKRSTKWLDGGDKQTNTSPRWWGNPIQIKPALLFWLSTHVCVAVNCRDFDKISADDGNVNLISPSLRRPHWS